MNRRKLVFWLIGMTVIFALALSFLAHPTATVVVVDAAGRPVVGAIIKGEGLGTKPGPGAYGWGPALGWGGLGGVVAMSVNGPGNPTP